MAELDAPAGGKHFDNYARSDESEEGKGKDMSRGEFDKMAVDKYGVTDVKERDTIWNNANNVPEGTEQEVADAEESLDAEEGAQAEQALSEISEEADSEQSAGEEHEGGEAEAAGGEAEAGGGEAEAGGGEAEAGGGEAEAGGGEAEAGGGEAEAGGGKAEAGGGEAEAGGGEAEAGTAGEVGDTKSFLQLLKDRPELMDTLFKGKFGDKGHGMGMKADHLIAWGAAQEPPIHFSQEQAQSIIAGIDENRNGTYHLDKWELEHILETGQQATPADK